MKITQQRLKEVFSYDSQTGDFTWLVSTTLSIKIGDVAGCVKSPGYRYIGIDGNVYLAHRLAWLYVHGAWPDNQIDHIDGNRSNNRIVNIRDVTQAENHRNQKIPKDNTSGVMGVYWVKREKKWEVSIRVLDALIYLGRYKDLATAIWIRQMSELKHGFHENHGKR